MATNKKLDTAFKVERQHIDLNQDLGELKMAAMLEASEEKFSDWRLELLWKLRDFKNGLLKHFDLEEEGGFMHDVLSVAPQAKNRIQNLKSEHEQILTQIDEILHQIKKMQKKDPEVLEMVRLKINELMAQICQHEIEESQLIQKAYYQEYGGPA